MSSNDAAVKLDVGGTEFKTTKATLTKHEGMFKTMLEFDGRVKRDENGCIFIDRDPKHFRMILNFMRDGDVDLPDNLKEIQEILKEARAYKLEILIKLCEEKVPVDAPGKFKIIESDHQMVQIITNPKKPIVIIYYKLDNWETATRYLDVTAFQKRHKDQFDIYFKPSTSPDTTWSYSIHDKIPSIFSKPKAVQENNFNWSIENCMSRFLEMKKMHMPLTE